MPHCWNRFPRCRHASSRLRSGKKKTAAETVHPLPASVAATPQDAKPWEKLIFSKAVTAVKRTTRFRAGNRDNFLFALGNKCYSKGLDEQTALRLAKNAFAQEYPDVESPLHNAYIYPDKTSEAATKKEEKKPVINQVMSFLEEHYGIRRNLILDRLEFMPYTPSADASGNRTCVPGQSTSLPFSRQRLGASNIKGRRYSDQISPQLKRRTISPMG